MWLHSSSWSKAVNSSLLCLVSMATLQSVIVGVNGVFVFNVSDLTHRTLPAFEQNFLKITNYALQKENTADLFTRISLSSAGVGKEKGVGGMERFKDMLKGLVSAVDERYSGVLQALQGLKREFEKNIHNATDHSPPRLQYKCCGGPPPIYRYQGRYREEVNISRECWGQAPETASQVFRLRADDAFHLMKKNYENNTALLWQYVATLDGHFVQFPSKNRHCDHNGNSVSPLTMRWMMEKVLQQRLNLVLLLDAGNHMLHTAVSSSDQAPVQHWLMAKEAAKRVVNELVATDRVSVIVLTNHSVLTPPGCSDRLLAATKRNAQVMWTFLDNTVPKGATNFSKGLEVAYNLFRTTIREQNRTDARNVIILMTNGMMSNLEQTAILDVVDKGKKSMDRSVFHLVHVIKPLASFTRYDVTVFRQLVERSNWTSARTSWLSSHRRPVEFAWWLKEIPDNVGFGFADKVAKFYTVFPPEDIFSSLDRILAVSPYVDQNTGLILTYAVQVFNDTELPKLYGVAAVEASMASMFSDVTSFQWGVHSYSFLVERDRGLVLVHPKLDIPSHKTATDPVFTTMDFLEPSFTPEQRAAILAANSSVMTFDTKVAPGRSTYKSGLDLSSAERIPATILYTRLIPSDYVIVLAIFENEKSLLEPDSDDMHLGALSDIFIYHNHMFINDTAADLCVTVDDIRYRNKVTVKFAPSVFMEPELYKYSRETHQDAAAMADFLSEDGYVPPKVRKNLLGSIIEDLLVVNSISLAHTWLTFNHDITERFMATPHGLYISFPGVSLPNAFDATEYGWYKKSMAWKDKIVVTFRRSLTTAEKSISISTALTTNTSARMYGVTGVGFPRRAFAALFFNSVRDGTTDLVLTSYSCLHGLNSQNDNFDILIGASTMGQYSYHLLTDDGYFLDVLKEDVTVFPSAERHITLVYPWLSIRLQQRNILKASWCTALSRGRHTLTYLLHISNGSYVTHDVTERDACRMFVLKHINGSNLLALVLADRRWQGCSESTPADVNNNTDCTPGGHTARLPRCKNCLVNTSSYQCPCYCDIDYNICDDSFQHLDRATFPITPCYEEPVVRTLTDRGASTPLPGVPLCGLQCPAFETQEACRGAADRCRWNDDDVFPVCESLQTTAMASSPTRPTAQPSTSSTSTTLTTSGASTTTVTAATDNTISCIECLSAHAPQSRKTKTDLSAGVIAGIVIGIVCLVGCLATAGFKFSRRPPLFRNCRRKGFETARNFDNAVYSPSHDKVQLAINPVSPSDMTQPTTTTTTTSPASQI